MDKLLLIDGNAVMHRAYHALPPLTSKSGEPIGAVYGFISMLLAIIEQLKPTHIVVAFDRKERLIRRDRYEGYQAQRPHMDSDLDIQFFRMAQFLEAAGIPAYSVSGYEADDVIGTIATQAKTHEVIIVTGDRDILQLVNERVRVYMPVKGVMEGKLYGAKEVVERMGVTPAQIVDYKALVGDASDNYPGVIGIGPKTAIKLIEEFGTFEKIYKNLDKIPAKVAKKLEAGKEGGEVSKALAIIVCDVKVNANLADSEKWDIDSPKVMTLFEEIGFKTLAKRVKQVGEKVDLEKQGVLL